MPLVECVANVSEGRDVSVIDKLTTALTAIQGVSVLDLHRDEDHHRCVLTFAGTDESVGEAAFAVAANAAAFIDLTRHVGRHPRVGATDVVPMIPLTGATMAQCVRLARRVGARIGEELQIPVFLYEEACDRPFRKKLEQVRQGGLEALTRRMQMDPAWAPDFGPARPHPTAGVTVVGARDPLIAFNVTLDSRDVTMARAIAATIRDANGGLPAVKAIGVELESRGCVQVSMNLTNYRRTPVHVAFEAVKQEAANKGVAVARGELVGLIPQEALAQAERYDFPCDALTREHVLEHRLKQRGVEA